MRGLFSRWTFVVVGSFAITFAISLAVLPSARAETVRSECVALGWQTEHAAVVVVGSVASDTEVGASGAREITIRVDESIRGTLGVDRTATIVVPDFGHGSHTAAGTRVLAFLDADPAAPAESPRFRLVSAEYGLRTIAGTGPESRFATIATQIAATLDPAGAVKDSEALRVLLVAWMEDADPGIAWSAATDFVRHFELHGALTTDESERVLAAYKRCSIGKDTKPALALALAATKNAGASAALVDTLLLPDAKSIRGTIALALRRLGDPATEARLSSKLASAPVGTRKTLLVALGVVGTKESVPAVRSCLGDEEVVVRVEAAHALGLIARTVRAAGGATDGATVLATDGEAGVDGCEDLVHIAAHAKSDDELRAALWALAQLDTRDAWSALRAVVADDKRTDLARRTAAEYLARPRVSLVLE